MLESIQLFLTTPLSIGSIQLLLTPIDFFLQILLPILGYIVLVRLVRRFFTRIAKMPFWQSSTRTKLLKRIHMGLRFLFFGATLWAIIWLQRDESAGLSQLVFQVLSQPLISTEQFQLTVFSLLLVVPIIYVANWMSKIVHRGLSSKVLPHIVQGEDVRLTLANSIRYVFMALFIVFGLSIVGINISSITLLIGALGVGIGFGLQGTVENIFAGVVIIATRSIKLNDRIRINDYMGDVKRINLLNTIVSTVANETLIIPNKLLVNNIVHNTTHEMDESVSLFLRFQVHYDSDLEEVSRILEGILKENPYDISDSKYPPRVYLYAFDDSGITFSTSCRIRSVFQLYAARSHINFAVWRAFKQANISIPYPHMDVHLSTGEGPDPQPQKNADTFAQ